MTAPLTTELAEAVEIARRTSTAPVVGLQVMPTADEVVLVARTLLALAAERDAMGKIVEAAIGLEPKLRYTHVCPAGCPLCRLVSAIDAYRSRNAKEPGHGG